MVDTLFGELKVLYTKGRLGNMKNTYEGILCERPVVVMKSKSGRRVNREIELAQRTDVFGGVAKLLYHYGDGNFHYFAYERFDMSVAEYTSRVNNAVHIPNVAEQIANIYQYMHSQDIILRVHDIENFNVAFTNKQKSEVIVKFYGLGCSREVEGDLLPEISSTTCQNQHKGGNKSWTPPETTKEKKAFGKKSDIYVLGNIFHQIGSGLNETPKLINISASDFRLIKNFEKQTELSKLVREMLNRVPQERLTATEVLAHPFFWSITKRARFYTQLKVTIEEHLLLVKHEKSIIYKMNDYNLMRAAFGTTDPVYKGMPAPDWSKKLPDKINNCFDNKYKRNQLSHLVRAIRNKSVHYVENEAAYFGEGRYACMATMCNLYPCMTEELWTMCRGYHTFMNAMSEFKRS